jgi:alkyl hydroperoxide reductase subunit AhpC
VFDAKAGCALRGTFVLDAEGLITWQTVNAMRRTPGPGSLLDRLAA